MPGSDLLEPDMQKTCTMISKRHFLATLVFMLTALLFATSTGGTLAAGQPVAMVTEISGEGEILRDGYAHSLRLLAELELNARARLKKDARVIVLYLQSGDQYALAGAGSFTLGQDQPRAEKQAAAPMRLASITGKDGKAMQIRNASLSQAGSVMRAGGRRPIPAKHPKAAVTLATPSLFEWEAIGKDVAYEFVLKDERGNTLFSRVLPENKLSLPGDIALDAGAVYRWSVSARGADGSRFLSVYVFRIADLDTKTGFNNFYPRETATVAERVAFVAWLERGGLSEEAARYWDELSKRYGVYEPSRISEK